MIEQQVTKENLYDMQLHTTLNVDSKTRVLKVVGGWIYTTLFAASMSHGGHTQCFVPEIERPTRNSTGPK